MNNDAHTYLELYEGLDPSCRETKDDTLEVFTFAAHAYQSNLQADSIVLLWYMQLNLVLVERRTKNKFTTFLENED